MKKLAHLSIITIGILTIPALTNAATYHYKDEATAKYKKIVLMPAPWSVNQGLRDGFYVGAQGGYDSYRVRQNLSDDDGDSFNPNLNPAGLVGGIFAGFGQYFSEVGYLGAEIFGSWSGSSSSWSATTPGASFHSTLKGKGDYGITFMPGIKLNNYTLGYLRLGYIRARFNTQEYGAITGEETFSTKKSAWKSGWVGGLGAEIAIYQNWSLRVDYTYASYQSFRNNVSGSKFSPSDNQFLLGLVYHFA